MTAKLTTVFSSGCNRPRLDEHLRVEGRRTWFEIIEEMQAVLGDYLIGYNQRPPHQGRGIKLQKAGNVLRRRPVKIEQQ